MRPTPTGATSGFTAAMASRAFNVAAPMTVPRAVVKESITSMSAPLSVVGGTTLREAGEGDDADAGPLDLLFHEERRRLLRDGEAVGLHVGGAHRARDVEGEDDRRPAEGHLDRHLRAGRGEGEACQAGEEQRHRDVPAPTGSGRGSASRTSATFEKRTAWARRRRSCQR